MSLELVPDKQAKIRPVGIGRKEPNVDPKLDPPPGRF